MRTHRVFLIWLLYIVIVIFGLGALTYLGLPQLALRYDHSYLTVLLFGLYALAEVLAGRQAWLISRENQIADQVIQQFKTHRLQYLTLSGDTVEYGVNDERHEVPPSAIADHFALLCNQAAAGQRIVQQQMLLDLTADRLYAKALVGDFIAARIVWIGILATILGVIMAFWPMIDGISIDTMRNNLGHFFGGIAVAFIPTAVSFVFKIVLDFNSRIIVSGVRQLIDKIACVSETEILHVFDAAL